MPKNVQLPDGRVVEFPDSMSDDAIAGVLKAQQPPPSTPGAAINPVNSSENPLTQFFQQAGQDLSQGGTRTAIGRLLGQMQGRGKRGYSGLNSGVSEGTANFMGSPELGVAKALEGVAMTPQHPVAGPVKAISGALQAATIPSLMVSGPNAGALIDQIPSRASAGSELNRIAEAAGNGPVSLENSQAALQRLAELGERGGAGKVPAGVTQLLNRSQGIEPLAYPEARDFVSNISDLSSLEKMGVNKQVGVQMNNLRSGLHQDIAQSLPEGLGEDYLNAIREYARASQLRSAMTGPAAKNVAKYALIGGLGAVGAGALGDALKKWAMR